MKGFIRFGWVGVGFIGMMFVRPVAAQIAIPPLVLQQQADREHKASQSTGDHASDTRGGAKDPAKQIELLKTAALGDDATKATTALHQLRAMGEPAKPALRDVVRLLLAHDRAAIENARGLPAASELRDLSAKIAAEREAARANIDKLAHDETLKIAHQHYDSLKSMWEKLHSAFGQADAVARALSRRGELLNMWKDLMPADKSHSDDSEAKLASKAERAFGFTAAQLSALPELGQGNPPTEPVLRDVWFYRVCRQIEKYNVSIEKYMSAGEWQDAQCVNVYREYLGILPYEYDPRLVESARGHSQEMITLKYFAHESPVAANKTPWDRIKTAGYPAGSGENIAYGTDSGEGVFWMWFDSPGHHQNMARVTNTTMGVGNVQTHWTQNMGSGRRLMLASPEEQKAAFANSKAVSKNG